MTYPKDSSKIHLFKINEKRFIFDVNSCIFTEIDKLAWDVIEKSTIVTNKEQLIQELISKYDIRRIHKAIEEFEVMESKGYILSEDPLINYQPKSSTLSTICLNIAQTCDLNCLYCFANAGTYNKEKPIMSSETSYKAVDFLLENSGKLRNLTLCFFGGEPLLNFPTIQKTVNYAHKRGAETGKKFRYNITTNGTRLTPSVMKYLAKNNFSIIFSIDGPKEIQDELRPFNNGKGSYDVVSKNLKELIIFAHKTKINFSIRSTYTRKLCDITRIALHLLDIGCYDLSIEPAVLHHDDLEIKMGDLSKIKEEYSRFARFYINEIGKGRIFSFFHFRHIMNHVFRATRNLTQCGAGSGYLAISSEGSIYPCHRFVGKEEYLMGNIFEGFKDSDTRELFVSAHVNNKKTCLQCWVRYVCGGGCHAYSIEFNGTILKPYAIECELMKHRIELGTYIFAKLASRTQQNLENIYLKSSLSRPYLNP